MIFRVKMPYFRYWTIIIIFFLILQPVVEDRIEEVQCDAMEYTSLRNIRDHDLRIRSTRVYILDATIVLLLRRRAECRNLLSQL